MLPKLHILEKTKIILYEKYHLKILEAPSENMIAVLEEIESIISEINAQIFQIIETEYTRDFDTRMSVPNLNMTTENVKIDNGALQSQRSTMTEQFQAQKTFGVHLEEEHGPNIELTQKRHEIREFSPPKLSPLKEF